MEFMQWMGREMFINVDGVTCVKCGFDMALRCTFFFSVPTSWPIASTTPVLSNCEVRSNYKDQYVLECTNSRCRRTQSIRRGSFFHHCKYDLYQQMRIICCFCEDMRVTVCARDLGVSRFRVTNYYDNLRGCYGDDLEERPIEFNSLGPFEADEFRLKHVETEPGIHATIWVQVIFERETGRYWAEVIPDRSADTLVSNIERMIPPGSVVFTDDWAGYKPLRRRGFNHFSVTHSKGEFSRLTTIKGREVDVHINGIEGLHRALRQRLMNKSRRNSERMELFIAEFIYRHSGRSLFHPFKIHTM